VTLDSGQHPDILCKHQSSDLLLQVHASQHLQSTTLPHTGTGAGPTPETCHLLSGLLQLAVGWAPCLCHQTPATNDATAWCSTFPSCPMSPHSSAHSTGFQLKLASTTRPWYLPTERNCPSLPSAYTQTLHPNRRTLFFHLWFLENNR
jgi:hypothetical protein